MVRTVSQGFTHNKFGHFGGRAIARPCQRRYKTERKIIFMKLCNTIAWAACILYASVSLASETSRAIHQTIADYYEFKGNSKNEDGEWLSYSDKKGDLLRRFLSTERVLSVYESTEFNEKDYEQLGVLAEAMKPFLKPYGQLAATSGGAYQEEFIDIYEFAYYYGLLVGKAMEHVDFETGDEDMNEMFNMIKAMINPVTKMLAKAFKSYMDQGVFVGDAEGQADSAYEMMIEKHAELFGG